MEAQIVVEAVVEQVADRALRPVRALEVAVAIVEIDRQAADDAVAEVPREDGADRREAAVEARERIALIVADDGELGVRGWSPGQARVDEGTLHPRRLGRAVGVPA